MRQIPKPSLIVKMLFLPPPSPCPRQIHTRMEGSAARGENFSSQGRLHYLRECKARNKQSGTRHWHENWPSSSPILSKPGSCREVLSMPAGQRRLQSTLKSCPASFSSSSVLLNKSPATFPFLLSPVLHRIVITDAAWSSVAPHPSIPSSGPRPPLLHRHHWRRLVFRSPPPLYPFLWSTAPSLPPSFLFSRLYWQNQTK